MVGAAVAFCSLADNVTDKGYEVLNVWGTIIINDGNSMLTKGQIVSDDDQLFSDRESRFKIKKESKALTLRLTGKSSVKELIEKVPNKYENVITNIQKNLRKARRANHDVYGVVTMETELDSLELSENEGFVLCEEDSIGNLNVIFIRHGMEQPQMYTLDANMYIYLLKMAIITAQGYDYAYNAETSSIYAVLWKPLEKFFKPGDTILMQIPESLSVFVMDEIPLNSDLRMQDVYNIFNMSETEY